MARRHRPSERLFSNRTHRSRHDEYPNFLRSVADTERIAFVDETYYSPKFKKLIGMVRYILGITPSPQPL